MKLESPFLSRNFLQPMQYHASPETIFFLLLKKIQMWLMRQCIIAKLDRVGPVDNRPPIN